MLDGRPNLDLTYDKGPLLTCYDYETNELVVTLNTIKKFTSNIYGKLGVRSRARAITRLPTN